MSRILLFQPTVVAVNSWAALAPASREFKIAFKLDLEPDPGRSIGMPIKLHAHTKAKGLFNRTNRSDYR